VARRPSGARYRIRDARTVLQAEQAWAPNGTDDVDEQLRSLVLRRDRAAHAGTGQRDRPSRPFTRADAGESRPRDSEQRQKRHGDHRELRARECDHPSSVALDL
jgi:hypothetical protein